MSCVETSRRYEAEIKKAFAELFPLANDRDLPSYPTHIPDFLRKRITLEVEERLRFYDRAIVRILSEVTRPKNHIEDMVRAAVNQAKATERVEEERNRLKLELIEANKQLSSAIDRLNQQNAEIGKLSGQIGDLQAQNVALQEKVDLAAKLKGGPKNGPEKDTRRS